MERMNQRGSSDEASMIRDHRRQWRSCLYVYPVVARRSHGLSIGVNLNPDKRCNFSCVYCQINRGIRRDLHEVELSFLADELHMALDEAVSGRIWHEKRFFQTPEPMRRINDIALSGDGEPTCLGNFDQAVRIIIESGRGSVSLLQRRLAIGYSRSSRLVDQMGLAGILGEHVGSKAREVLISMDDWEQMQAMEENESNIDTDPAYVDDDPDGLSESVPEEYVGEYRN